MTTQETVEIAKLQERGQITIPLSIRDRFGLKKGAQIVFRLQTNSILLEPMYSRRKKKLISIADATIGSINLKNHPEWHAKRKVQDWVDSIRKEWK